MNYLETLRTQVATMARDFVAMLPQMGIAIIVLFVTWIAARVLSGAARRATSGAHIRESLKQLVETLATLGVWIVGLLIAAAIVLPGFTPGSAIAGLGVGAVAIGFAFQDIFENFLAGVLIMLRQKMRIGDVIECEGTLGRVEHISLRETHIRQLTNELTIMPNSMLFKNAVKILTDEAQRRDELIVGVSYDTDLDLAKRTIEDAVSRADGVLKDRYVVVFAQQFGLSSIDFQVQWWASAKPLKLRETKSAVLISVKKALDEAGIEIPFPYVTHTFKEPVPLARDWQIVSEDTDGAD